MTTTASAQPVDISDCDREPIHVPGRIQPYGVLLALAEPDLRIIQASANTAQYIGMVAEALLGQPLAALLGNEHVDYLRNTLAIEQIDQNPLYVWTVQINGSEQPFDGVIHRQNGVLILELELASPVRAARPISNT